MSLPLVVVKDNGGTAPALDANRTESSVLLPRLDEEGGEAEVAEGEEKGAGEG